MGVSTELIDEKAAKKLSHDQLEIHKISANSHLLEIENFIFKLTENPEIQKHKLINKIDLKSSKKSIIKGLEHLKLLQKLEILNFSRYDYKYFIDTLKELYEFRLKIDKKTKNELNIEIDKYLDFLEKFAPSHYAIEVKKVFEEENRVTILQNLEKFAKYQFKLIFIYYTFFFCAVVTSKHSTSPRYPNKNTNPLLLYRKSNPIVKFQPIFMEYLFIAIKSFKKMNY